MKVAMLTTVGERCGIAAYTRALIEGLQTLPDVEVQVVPITEGKQPTAHYVEQAKLLNAPAVDVVHIQHEHSFWGGILPKTSAFWEMRYLIQKPVVLTAHTTYSLAEMLKIKTERRPHKWLAKRLLLANRPYRESVEIAPFMTAMTIVHTDAARKEMMARGANGAYIHVIPTGMPAPLPAPTQGQAFRERFGLEGRRLLTLFGYIAYNKGYELTLEILPDLPEDVVLVIAGGARNADGEAYQASVEAMIARAGLEKRVIITGFLEEEAIAEAMAASDLVLAPHTQATGSYSIALPLTYGRPILASNLDCFQEISLRLDCLELFQAGDAADYRTHLQMLLQNATRRNILAANARRYAQRFAWPRVAALTRDVYQSAIEFYGRGHHGRQ